MNLKKFAVTGLITIAVIAALCMYFSGTIVNITTPKVKLLSVKQGKLETSVSLVGTLVYTETRDITVDLPEESTVTVRQVYVRPGSKVAEGELIFETEINGYATKMHTLQNEYSDAVDALNEFERKSTSIKLTPRDRAYADADNALKSAGRECSAAEINVQLLLAAQDVKWSAGDSIPSDADENVKRAYESYQTAKGKLDTAEADYARVSRFGIDESTWEYIQERENLTTKVKDCQEKCLALQKDAATVSQILAPQDGYISAVQVKTSDSYDGSSAMYSMTTVNGYPALQFDLSEVTQTVAKGDTIHLTSSQYGTLTAKIESISYNADGKRCAYVPVTDEIINAYGSLNALGQMSEVEAKIISRSMTTTCLVPVSAIHGTGTGRYVFVIDTTNSTLSGKTMTIRKLPITVIAEANGYASINEDVSYYKLVYMEDRSLEDGSTVMEYAK